MYFFAAAHPPQDCGDRTRSLACTRSSAGTPPPPGGANVNREWSESSVAYIKHYPGLRKSSFRCKRQVDTTDGLYDQAIRADYFKFAGDFSMPASGQARKTLWISRSWYTEWGKMSGRIRQEQGNFLGNLNKAELYQRKWHAQVARRDMQVSDPRQANLTEAVHHRVLSTEK
ncbi:hypothetical protein BD769DRAFT_1690179 [Suillus cothurnatus]|nr:hypothetical protein BD769DRAFT_1690179 [Suillus cothurnatus]